MTSAAPSPAVILCADWGKDGRKRAVFVAEVASRSVRQATPCTWSLAAVLEEADCWTRRGSVLAAFDLPFGVPQSFDYGAWQLLRDTLHEAEAEDAIHLGKAAVVEPISERMAQLTGGLLPSSQASPTDPGPRQI